MSFGLTPADVEQWANGLTFADAAVGPPVVVATTPSRAACVAEISRAADRVNGILRGKGISPDAVVDSGPARETYSTCRQLVLLEVVAWALRSRGRYDPDQAKANMAERKYYLEQLKDPASWGGARNTSDTAAGIARGPQATSVPVEQSLYARMQRTGMA